MEYNTVVINLLSALGRNLDKGAEEKVGYAGGNTGNLMFTEAMKDQLDYEREIWIYPDRIKGLEHPSVVLPSANFIIQSEKTVFTALINFLENTDCPVTLAGLGAQATLGETPAKLVRKLSPTHTKALKMVAERAVSLGVRGEYTAECLNELGIKNVRIIGCPSFYFRLQNRSHKVKIPSLDRTQITVTPGNVHETKIVETGRAVNAFWMMQMTTEYPQLGLEQEVWNADWKKLLENVYPGKNMTAEDVWKYMRERGRMFFTREEWDAFYEKEDITFAFGSRFHGNMAAFRNGVPALWIVHDTRTMELINTLHLPSITYEKWQKVKYPEELLEYCDYHEYEKHYSQLHRDYIAFLEENHLRHKMSL